MTCSHIIYVLLLLVNVITAIYIGKIAWNERKSNSETRLMAVMFLALSVLGITQLFHLMESEIIWFTFTAIHDIVHLLCK